MTLRDRSTILDAGSAPWRSAIAGRHRARSAAAADLLGLLILVVLLGAYLIAG